MKNPYWINVQDLTNEEILRLPGLPSKEFYLRASPNFEDDPIRYCNDVRRVLELWALVHNGVKVYP